MASRSPAVTRGVAAIVGVGALAGGLLATGAASPLIKDAVSLASGPAPAADDGRARVDGERVAGVAEWSSGWMDDDSRPEWGSDRLVPSGPSGADRAQAPTPPDSPRIQVPENPTGRQLFQNPATGMRRYTMQPRSSCFQPRGPSMPVQNFGATAGRGSATLTWWDLGDPDAVEYQIDIVRTSDSGEQRSMTVKPPNTCKQMTVTVTGLKSGASYGFWLTATNRSPEQDGALYRAGRGDTSDVRIL